MDQILVHRVLGTAAVILVIAVSTVLLDWRYAPVPGSYEVMAELGRAGAGVNRGTDVKVRGVRIGEVDRVFYADGTAFAVMVLDPEPRLPAAEELGLVVNAKTFLGEKQIELSFAPESFGIGPFLDEAEDPVIVASRQPTEVMEAIDALEPFLAAIDARDLATIIDTLGEQEGEGEIIAENIELGQQLASFAERTADDSLDRLRAFTDVMEALTDAVPDLTRTAVALPEATAVLVERQADLRANLETISRFSRTFARFLRVEEPIISRFLRTSDPVGAMLERQQQQIGSLVEGIMTYMKGLGAGGLLLDDGSELGYFRLFIRPERLDLVDLMCHEFETEFGEQPPVLCDDDAEDDA